MIISSVPVGIPLFGALCVAVVAKKITRKFVHSRSKTAVECRIYAGQSRISLPAFFDSGNKVYRRGVPVSVLPESCAKKLADLSRIKTYVTVHTVAGDKNLPVFTADKVEIDYGERVITLRGVLFCASRELSRHAVLHPDLAEAE